jgi:hypothetical protein
MKFLQITSNSIISVSTFCFTLSVCSTTFGLTLGSEKYSGPDLPPSTIDVPHERTMHWKNESSVGDGYFNDFANTSLKKVQRSGKGDGTHILFGHLLAHKDLAETNALILSLKPWGVSGTSGWQNKKGDYDFEEAVLTTVLYRFANEPEILTPEARDHILNVLLIDQGDGYRTTAPNTFGLFEETENHLLMTEGSRYLKNQWLRAHGNTNPLYNNETNGMEDHLISLLTTMTSKGMHEFNSQPYVGYTLLGLLNLEGYASQKVSTAARNVLDYLNFSYALGSYNLRRFPPFRRRYEYAGMTSLTGSYHTTFIKTWLSFADPVLPVPAIQYGASGHGEMAAASHYRLPDAVVNLILNKPKAYFVKLGHGLEASPEIYSADPRFLISNGGVNRGESTVLVARPITLICESTTENLSSTFHISGPGSDFKAWNNTGVYKNFACAAGPVQVPRKAKLLAENTIWKIYSIAQNLLVAVYSKPNFGIISVLPNGEANKLLTDLTALNNDENSLYHVFKSLDQHTLTYDTLSPKDTWVIASDNGQPLDRKFDAWPLLSGDY